MRSTTSPASLGPFQTVSASWSARDKEQGPAQRPPPSKTQPNILQVDSYAGEFGFPKTSDKGDGTLSSCLWHETRAVGQVRIDRQERLTLVLERWTGDSDTTTATRSVLARAGRGRGTRNDGPGGGARLQLALHGDRDRAGVELHPGNLDGIHGAVRDIDEDRRPHANLEGPSADNAGFLEASILHANSLARATG